METRLEAPAVPGSANLPAWRQAVSDGRYLQFRFEDIVAAIQDLGPKADKGVLNPLAKHVSDCMFHMLRGMVGTNHANRGDDIIDDVHQRLWEALLKPSSADGRGLRAAFAPRVRFRMLDALARAAKSRTQSLSAQPDGSACRYRTSEPEAQFDGQGGTAFSGLQEIEVNDLLEIIPDHRKRLAFRLYMDGVPCKSNRGDSIEKALGVSERTVREWIKEVQEILKQHMGDVS